MLYCLKSHHLWLVFALTQLGARSGRATPSSDQTFAVLGDSISTGAVAHQDISFDMVKLAAIVEGKRSLDLRREHLQALQEIGVDDDRFMSPTRVWYSLRDFQGGLSWVSKHLLSAFSDHYLDVEELSWFYGLSRLMQIKPEHMIVAAENGARMEASVRQYDRVLDYLDGYAPDQLFVFFTGNDLCGPSMEFVNDPGRFKKDLLYFLDYLRRNSKFKARGTDIWLMDMIGVLQIVFSPSIQQKVVKSHGKMMTCKEVHELPMNQPRDYQEGVLSLIPQTPAAYCRTLVVNKTKEDHNRLITLGNYIQADRLALKQIVEDDHTAGNNKSPSSSQIRLHHLQSSGKILLEPEHIAEDCFHLSYQGQMKLAQLVYQEMTQNQ